MLDAPAFFVPAATLETQESVYTQFAKWCGIPAPPTDKRVYSIVFSHDGEIWHATVGESMHGTRYSTHKMKGKKVERSQPVNDPALVLAIFPGSPYIVVTNHLIAENVHSRWANPFLAGEPKTITRFANPK
jgi:hypothetical protein